MIIPKNIVIGGRKYNIKQKRIIDWRNKSVVGQISYYSKNMKIQKMDDGKYKEDIFFHEIAHGVLKELEFNFPKISKFRNNEEFVQELGLTLRKTFLDLLEKQ